MIYNHRQVPLLVTILTFMDWFYMSLQVSFLCCFVCTMWAWDLLTFMDWFYVRLKVSFHSCFVFTTWAWELLTFMDWFYVYLKVPFCSCFVFTMGAWDLLTFMDWFYVCLKVPFLSECGLLKDNKRVLSQKFPCPHCEYKATFKGSLQTHIKSVHEGKKLMP